MKTSNNDKLVSFGGSIYYIDLDAMDRQIFSKPENKEVSNITETVHFDPETNKPTSVIRTKSTGEREDDYNASRDSLLRTMIDIVLEDEEMDDSLGSDRALDKASLPFKISFNTLMINEILKEI